MKDLIQPITFVALLLALSISSCQKNLKTANSESNDNLKTINPSEQAYPGLHGETFSTKFRNNVIYVEKKGGKYVWLGDIAFDERTFDSLKKNESTPSQRTFTNNPNNYWPNGEVFYTIQAGFTPSEQSMINDALNHWRTNTGLLFTQRTNQSDYVIIVPGALNSGLYSDYVGKKGGFQVINLESGIFITGNVIHELGHVVGFYHEQCRTDRGNAININTDNIVPHNDGTLYQYKTYEEIHEQGFQIGDFDFGSVMLYGSFANSDNVHPVMTRLDGTTFNGQRIGLSGGDITTANYIYGPPYVKFREETVSFSDDFNTTELIQNEFIDFFSNRACTATFNLDINRPIRVRHVKMVYDRSGTGVWETTLDRVETVNLTAGSTSYPVGQTRNYEQRDGTYNTTYAEQEWYSAVEPSFR